MTIRQTDAAAAAAQPVDTVTLDQTAGMAQLKILAHQPWSESHLLELQDRINHCLQWVESGQFFLRYPQASGCEIAIDVQSIYAPDEDALMFLRAASQALEDAGYLLGWRPLGSDYVDPEST